MARTDQTAYRAGVAAGQELVPLYANPFPKGSLEWSDWRIGWDVGVDNLAPVKHWRFAQSACKPSLDEIELDQYINEFEDLSYEEDDDVLDCVEKMENYNG